MAKLTIEDMRSALKRLPDWSLADKREAIQRKFQFVDFVRVPVELVPVRVA